MLTLKAVLIESIEKLTEKVVPVKANAMSQHRFSSRTDSSIDISNPLAKLNLVMLRTQALGTA
jgi:hypothetical protein